MPETPDLPSLLARVKEAKGPDKELFRAVAYALLNVSEVKCFDAFWRFLDAEAWESAALALCARVLPGWRWTVTSDGRKEGVPRAWLWIERRWIDDSDLEPPMLRNIDAEAATPALALLAALITARMEKKDD